MFEKFCKILWIFSSIAVNAESLKPKSSKNDRFSRIVGRLGYEKSDKVDWPKTEKMNGRVPLWKR